METKTTHCRFCAQEKKEEELLLLTESDQYLKLIDTFKIDFINFSDTRLPKTLCEYCCDEFKSCYLFFTKVKDSQEILNKFYNTEIKEEPNDSVYIKNEPISDDEQINTELNEEKYEILPHLFKANITKTYQRSSRKVANSTPITTKRTVTDNEDANGQIGRKDPDIAPVEGIYLTASDKRNLSYVTTSKKKKINKPKIKDTLNYDNNNITINSSKKINKSSSFRPNNDINHCLNIPDQESCDKEGTTDADNDISLNNDDGNASVLPCESINKSWSDYPWSCRHCGIDFESMEEVRGHSKELHGRCYGFKCRDCNNKFNTFNSFIEHVRRHREVLRYYCQYCNEKFDSPTLCVDHALTHWSNSQKICNLCGEICPDANSLETHRKLYKEAKIRKKIPRPLIPKCGKTLHNDISVESDCFGNWSEYKWTCEDCWVRYPDVDSLRLHAREFHNKCFSMKCVDCLKVSANYPAFVAHVTAHRPYLKKYCQYCDQYCIDEAELTNHVNNHLEGDHVPCDGCGQIFDSNTQLLQHLKQFKPKRTIGRVTKEELTCNVCLRTFKCLSKLQAHVKTHETNRKRNHICDICGKSFFYFNCLANHVLRHSRKSQEFCLICKRTFSSKGSLKVHVLTHTDIKVYMCDICGKKFKSKRRVQNHIISHSDVKPFQCTICPKRFKIKRALNNHIKIHKGIRSYACECCDRSFTNWGNCNKHMIRIHGVTLAKTKNTPLGKAEINKKTGKLKKMQFDKNAKDWLEQILNPGTGKNPDK